MTDVEVRWNVEATMRDGTVLRADVYTPEGDGPFPVLVMRTPYDKNVTFGHDFLTTARAGYIAVIQDARGSFTSDGEWMPWKHEREDGYDTIEWAATLPKSNGRVGMLGMSYNGSTQWSAAVERPPHLAAIAPTMTWSDPEDGLLFRGGAVELGVNAYWGTAQAISRYFRTDVGPDVAMARTMQTIDYFDNIADRGYWELPAGKVSVLAENDMPDLGVARALADPATTNDSRVSNRYDDVDVPALVTAGWYDIFLQGALDNFDGLRSRGKTARLVVGPWGHTTLPAAMGSRVGEVNFGMGSLLPGGMSVQNLQHEWYEHWLQGAPATEAHESGVLIFVMGINRWRAEPEWPLARALDTPLYLDKKSALSWEPNTAIGDESTYAYDPADPVISRGGNLVMSSDYEAGVFDQRDTEARDDVLVFTTPPLEQDLEITGRVRATLFAETDGPSTDWVVRLCEVDSKGVSRNLVDGITRVHNEPNRVDEVNVDLWSTSIVVREGHKLRVHVTSSNFPRWDRNLNAGDSEAEKLTGRVAKQRILHDSQHPSRIILPVIPN
ncbi:CocE/NonD family hydrolase [Streptomyces sp. NPDC004044]